MSPSLSRVSPSHPGSRSLKTMKIIVSICSVQQLWPAGKRLLDVWRGICHAMNVPCVDHSPTAEVNPASLVLQRGPPIVLMDSTCELQPDDPDVLASDWLYILFSWDRKSCPQSNRSPTCSFHG